MSRRRSQFLKTLETLKLGNQVIGVASCKDFSDDAKLLAAKFDHDSKALQKVFDYFSGRCPPGGTPNAHPSLNHADQELLDNCVSNLEGLLSRAQSLGARIKSKKWYRAGINHSTWWLYKRDFENLAKELYEWTQRFDVHTFTLPNSIKSVIKFEEPPVQGKFASPSLLAVQQQVAQIVELDGNKRAQYGERLHITDYESRIVPGQSLSHINYDNFSSSAGHNCPQSVGTFDRQAVVLEKRQAGRHFAYGDHRSLASVLSQTHSSVRLLECLSFYNVSDPENFPRQNMGGTTFIFKMPTSPSRTLKFETLRGCIRDTSFHTDGSRILPDHP